MKEDKFAEVSVISNQDALLCIGSRKDMRVLEIGRIVGADSGNVAPEASQVRHETSIRAGVDQKSHAYAR